MLDAHGNLKSLSTDMGVLYKHIEEHSKGGSDKNGFFKSIFGTSGMNGAMILAKSSKEVKGLTKRTEKAGKTGTYVAKLAAKNMGTAQGSANSAHQAMNAFKMTLGNAVLPAINEASNSLAKFLLSKDGEKFQKNVGKVVGDFANGLVSLIRFATQHETMMKFVGGGFLAGYATVKVAKAVSFVGGLYEQYKRLTGITPKIKDLENVTSRSAGVKSGLSKYLTGNRLVFGATVAFSAAQIGTDFYKAATAKSTQDRIADVGAGAGNLIGTGIGAALGGKAGAAIGSQLGQAMGPAAAKSFNKAFNPNTRFNLKNPKPIAHGKRHIVQYTENGYYYTIGKGKRKYFKDQRNYSEKELNTGHRLDATQFLQAKNPVDFVTGALSGGYQLISHLNDLDYLRRSIKFANASSQKGWFNDFFFKPMGKPKFKDHGDIGKGFRTAIGNWFRSKPNAGRAYESTPGEKWLASLFGGDKVQAAELTKAQRKALRNGKTIGENATKGAKAGMKDFPSWTKQLSAKSNKWFKSKWNGMKSWAGGVNKNVQSGWHGFTSWSGNLSHRSSKFFKSKWSGMQSWAGGINKDVQSGWKGIKTWFGNLGKNAVDLFKKPFEGLSKWVSDHTPKPVKAALGAVGKGVNWVKGKLTGKAHANGGLMHTSHGALVGEAGPELAYKPYANNVRLLGANGPQFTRVHAGEHILNARDTAKVLSGGLGAGTTLKGYASGTDKLKKASKSVTDDYKAIASKSTKSLKKLTRSNKQAFKQVNTDANKLTKQTKTRTVANFKQMHHGITKQMDAIHDGVIRSGKSTAKGFGGAMDKMHKYAHSAMADTTHQLNRGISSIDKVLGQFGGNNSVIKPIKFAKGTDQQGRLTHNTLAMVNDATQGPRQEALVSPDNRLYLPKGQNVQLMLPKGWGVLNGAQTKQVTNKTVVKHFAKGTGVSHSALRKLAENAGANPSKWFKSTYSNDIKQHGSDLNKGTTALGSNSSTKYGNPWSNALWGVINKQIDSDDGGSINATGLLKAAEKYGEGHRYVWGATGPNTFDCSGLVMYTLKHAYGINYPHFSGSQYNMTRHISKGEAHMGDLVFWGAGGSDHVGIYAGGNKYFSAESPSQGIHMNTLDSVVGKGRPLFGRIKGMPSQKSKAKHVKKPDSRLTALVKRELGASALKWIKDKLGEEGGSFGNPAGDGVRRWRKYITRAASQMHTSVTGTEISKILSMISSESSGNPTITQQIQDINSAKGTPAQGLLQFVPSTFNAFAVKGHHKLLNGYDQLLALFNDSNWRNDIHFGGGWGPSGHRRFAKGGKPIVGKNVIVGEHGPEIARFTDPVHIYSNEKSKKSLDLGKLPSSKDISQKSLEISKLPSVQKASTKKHHLGTFAPVININFNGSASDFDSKQARKIAEIVQRELEKVFNSIDEEFC